MAHELTPDICVIGGGPAGLAVAEGAARLGISVVLIEKDSLGGAYLHAGAMTSKALFSAASAREWLRRAPAAGVTGAPLQVNFAKMREYLESVQEAVAATVTAERLTALGITIVEGAAKFVDARGIEVGGTRVRARRLVLATGTRQTAPTIDGLADLDYLTAETALDLGRKPSHMVVLGDDPHALELAQAYVRLGVDATVVSADRPLGEHDREHADIVAERLEAEGVRQRYGLAVVSAAKRRGGYRLIIREGEGAETNIDCTHLVVAARRTPDIDKLGLAAAGIDHDAQGVTVDAQLRTTNRRVYAIGDAVAGPAGVARARAHAQRVLRSIVYRLASRASPAPARVVHTDPGIAAVGWSEEDARARHDGVRVLRYPFNEVARAHIERTPHGVVKAVVSRRGRVLGASVVGHAAEELITPWSLAVARQLPVAALADMSVAQPSLSEVTMRAAEEYGKLDLTPEWRRRIIRLLRIFG
ncbi:MAG: dihydrolipoyl dehydrogenase family protein [Alphaproteobacteria bacterium]